jgi:hypothetical protein
MSWQDTCSCGSTRFWVSRTAYKVCYDCAPDVWAALLILARRGGAAAVKAVESWRQAMEAGGGRVHDQEAS